MRLDKAVENDDKPKIKFYNRQSIGYWAKREYLKARDSIFEETQLKTLFRKQAGRCKHCKGPITQEDIQKYNVHKHHITPRSKGGKWNPGNLQLLHDTCHQELHSVM